MKTIISILSVLISVFTFGIFNNDNSVCPVPAEITTNNWHVDNLYNISIEDGVYVFNGKEALLNNNAIDAIDRIINTDNVSYPGQIDIAVKYIADEDLYIINLSDPID